MKIEDWKKFDAGRGDIKDTRDLIQAQMNRMKTEVDKLFKTGSFSFTELAKRLGRGGGDDVFSAFGTRIDKLRSLGHIGNAVVYECALSSLKSYSGAKKLPFGKLTPTWLEKYDTSMEEAGKSASTRSMYLRALRAVILATDNNSPFGGRHGFTIKAGRGRKTALTKTQINDVLMKMAVVPGSPTEKMRDMFYFSYLANGINVKDIILLRWSDMSNGNITYVRAKTHRTNAEERVILIPVLKQMQRIIDKWGNPEGKYIFGYLSDKPTDEEIYTTTKNLVRQINKHLKKLTKNTTLGRVTSYTARHSFASVHLKNNTNLGMISQLMGHSRITTTQAYLSDFDADEVRAANEGL